MCPENNNNNFYAKLRDNNMTTTGSRGLRQLDRITFFAKLCTKKENNEIVKS